MLFCDNFGYLLNKILVCIIIICLKYTEKLVIAEMLR
jgi:hypothetical protein